jgi:hypothetical protein
MHGASGITNPELPSSAVLVAAACVLASTSVFARGAALGMAAGLRTVAASCAILPPSWDHQHRGCPLSKTGFRPHSRHLRSRASLPLTRYNQPAEAMEYWRRYLAKDSQSEWAAPGPPA